MNLIAHYRIAVYRLGRAFPALRRAFYRHVVCPERGHRFKMDANCCIYCHAPLEQA